MAERTRYLTIAILLTLLDAAVALYYGRAIWAAWSGIIWAQLLIVLLAAVWATTLAHVWAYALAVRGLTRSLDRPRPGIVTGRAAISTQAPGEADV